MNAIPRPSTAGRQRPGSATTRTAPRPAAPTTPRGTSSVLNGADENIPEDHSIDSARGHATSRQSSFVGLIKASHAGVDTAVQTVDTSKEEKAQRELMDHEVHLASSRSLEAASHALTKRLERAKETLAATENHKKISSRCCALEAEVQQLKQALAAKSEEAQDAKRHLMQLQMMHGSSTAKKHAERGAYRPTMVLDVTGLCNVDNMQNEYSRVISQIAPSAGPMGSGNAVLTSSAGGISCSAATSNDVANYTSSLERLKREWRHSREQPQQQQHVERLTADSSGGVFDSCEVFTPSPAILASLGAAVSDPMYSYTSSASCSASSASGKLATNTNGSSGAESAAPSKTVNTEALDAQREIIALLERENAHLRKQRDDTLIQNQKEHQRLMQELEEARETLDEKGADWHEKQKELNRLRTLMRFSQLKRDSDKLQETYVRIDTLENTLRQMHAKTHKDALDREDLHRLRVIELQLVRALRGEIPWSAFPKELLQRQSQQQNGTDKSMSTTVPQRAVVPQQPSLLTGFQGTGSMLPMRPSTAKVGVSTLTNNGCRTNAPANKTEASSSIEGNAVLQRQPPAPPSSIKKIVLEDDDAFIVKDDDEDTPVKTHSSTGNSDVVAAVAAEPPFPPDLAAENQPTSVRDEDVSFSTITERMQAYLQRRQKKQTEDAIAAQQQQAKKKPLIGASSTRATSSTSTSKHSMDDMAMSNFAQRIERLRSQHDPLHSNSGTGTSRPVSASRPSANSVGSNQIWGASSTSTANATTYGMQRPSSASVSRSSGSASLSSLIGSRAVPAR